MPTEDANLPGPDAVPTATETHYALKKTLGAGAMGEIWLARDTGLRRQVAYKRMHPHIATQKDALSRFLREMQITAQLDHPHIVPVYECEMNPDGSLAYAMKLVKGRTLKDVLLEKRALLEKGLPIDAEYSLNRLLDYFLNVCDAMHFAHSKGVIHRDLKPVNLMIGEFGEVYVMDWGIARRIGGDTDESDTGQPEHIVPISTSTRPASGRFSAPRAICHPSRPPAKTKRSTAVRINSRSG
jgi:serine/threonine protein kinase